MNITVKQSELGWKDLQDGYAYRILKTGNSVYWPVGAIVLCLVAFDRTMSHQLLVAGGETRSHTVDNFGGYSFELVGKIKGIEVTIG